MPDLTKSGTDGKDGKEPRDAPVAPAAPAAAEPAPGKPHSLWSDAWHDLRRSPVFLISAAMILLLLLMAFFPSLFTSGDPRGADLDKFLQEPDFGAVFQPEWLGYDGQGYSIYTRMIYGTRASITVGVLTTLIVTLLGGVTGMLAGYFGGWVDALISRFIDVFLGIPFLLGAMVVLVALETRTVYVVVTALVIFGWTLVARVMRGSVISVKQADYVQAARALGAGTPRILLRHILPNAVAPVIVVATIALGGYIAAEATLTYLGIGLQPPTVSWGVDISAGKDQIRTAPHVLLWPGVILSFTILAFIMLGDAVREALDPKLR
ncbi:ABC transporter permease [Streptomyces sp. E11-3]|uniref:ABC transporter permease n=1 Tax=Streptomyces sp. E11-3 TaxID=3110112 RepID=UPI00397EA78D